jgi:hypothetical protein
VKEGFIALRAEFCVCFELCGSFLNGIVSLIISIIISKRMISLLPYEYVKEVVVDDLTCDITNKQTNSVA